MGSHLDVEDGGEGGDHEPAGEAGAGRDVHLAHTHLEQGGVGDT